VVAVNGFEGGGFGLGELKGSAEIFLRINKGVIRRMHVLGRGITIMDKTDKIR